MTLTSYVVESHRNRGSFEPDEDVVSENKWWRAFADLIFDAAPTEHMVIGALTLLSNSMQSGQSLPPFLPLPKPHELTQELLRLSAAKGNGVGILDLRNVEQFGYAEFAVIELCETHMRDDLEGLIRDVSGLVGFVDFGFPATTKIP